MFSCISKSVAYWSELHTKIWCRVNNTNVDPPIFVRNKYFYCFISPRAKRQEFSRDSRVFLVCFIRGNLFGFSTYVNAFLTGHGPSSVVFRPSIRNRVPSKPFDWTWIFFETYRPFLKLYETFWKTRKNPDEPSEKRTQSTLLRSGVNARFVRPRPAIFHLCDILSSE